MKFSFRFVSDLTKCGVGLIVVASLWAAEYSLALPGHPAEQAALPNLDTRTSAGLSSAEAKQRNDGLAQLQGQVAGATVAFDPLLEKPKFIRAGIGFLTGPNGEGLAVSAQTAAAYASNDPFRGIKAFLDDHTALFGHGAEALQTATVNRDSVGAHNGLRTAVWQQRLDGLPVFESVLIGNIAAGGQVVSLGGSFIPQAGAAADVGTPNRAALQAEPTVSSPAAIIAAAQNLGDTLSPSDVSLAGAVAGDGFQKLTVQQKEVHARLVWLPMNRGSLRLCWEAILRKQNSHLLYQILVDAADGTVYVRRSLTRDISDASYQVYPSDSPSPLSPGHPTPSAVQPPLVNRVLITTSALDTTASPNGWINDGDNETQGNNVDTFTDRNFDQQPDGPRPQGNPNRVFDFPLDLTQAPLTYTNASSVQLFYLINRYHDELYQLGFTESAGNFQNDNFGRGGLGNDRIISYVQSGADVGIANNAAFGTPPDGLNGEMYQFVMNFPNPDRDSSLDAEVVFHEATHGTSQRLVGGGVLISALQTDGMGEGWGDFVGLSLLSEPADNPDAVYASGAYFGYQLLGLTENYYYGDRHFPYSTDLAKNPFTFKDIDPGQISSHPGVPRSPLYSPFNALEADEVHHQGEIWCVTLWEVRANLIHKHGFAGNRLMLQLVIDGMKLGPANPTFLEARDAILLADQVNNGGANYLEIWQGFAKRGMGFSASSPASRTTAGVREAFDLPGLQVAAAILSGGNGNGVVDFNECNDLYLVLTNLTPTGLSNVQVTVSTTTPGVALGVRTSAYLDMPAGGGGMNLVPFKLSTAPFFICGMPIELTVQIKSDQLTSTTIYTLTTGTPGAITRFDNANPAAIPDFNAEGTNSTITVSNITTALNKVTVALFLTHTWDSDLTLRLVGPDGTTVLLSANNGGSGDNYGAACTPDEFRTTFDDAASAPITGAAAPFVGTFQPQAPLSVFGGKSGTNVNGNWTLHVVDDVGFDVGVLQCWSLFLTTAECTDGGGTCPGADLRIGMTDAPDPVFIGSNLVYTINITNNGPSEAKGVVISHSLPPSVVFASAFTTQGSVSHSGGTVVANIGNLPFTGRATVTVNVIPTLAGNISSSATASSNDPDPDTSNNSVTVSTRVNPPASDLAVGLLDAPDPVLVGGTLNYTVSVTNKGPSTASGVMVTNTFHISTPILSATPSQGSVSINGNVVVFNFGALTNAGRASGTINVTPTAAGNISATSVVRANQNDPIQANNTATATTVVGPAADLTLTLTDIPDPVVAGSNWVYTITVTNNGPTAASSVVINQTLSAGVTVMATSASTGNVVASGDSIVTTIPSLPNGAGVVVTVTARCLTNGTTFSSATVSAAEADPNLADNNASVSTLVAAPFASIVAAGSTLTAESVNPPDGAISVGETVTIQLRLANAGNVTTPPVTATLLATNGVTAPSGTALSYGVLSAGGSSASQTFSFTASGTNGGTIAATLQVFTNGVFHTNVVFNFTLPTVHTFANSNLILIAENPTNAGPAAPYPAIINVSGLSGLVGKVSVTLSNLSHANTDDLDALLVSPSGQKVLLLSDAGGFNGIANINLTFDDAGAVLPDESQIVAASYHPADYEPGDVLAAPAPAGPYASSLSAFAGAGANGNWSLYIMDDAIGDKGSLSNGWSLAFTTITPVNQIADLGLAASATPNPGLVGSGVTTVFTVTNAGPNTAAGVALTNVVPSGATLVSAIASKGSVSTNGNTVIASLGSLNAGSSATVTVVVVPGVGSLTNSTTGVVISPATVGTTDTDLNSGNNAAAAVAVVSLPVVDVALAQTVATNYITLNSNVTFAVTVTNSGPQTALDVVVNDPLPAGFTFVSTTALGYTNAANNLSINVGNLAAGSASSFTITATAAAAGTSTNTITAATSSSDTNPANNSVALLLNVVSPAPSIVAAGQLITVESVTVNGAVDLGETVTVSLTLQNVGIAPTTNLRASLQSSGGVSAPSGPQSYGALAAGSGSATRSFTFTAPNTSGGVVVATLALKDEKPGVTNDLGTVAFVFNLPATLSFTNAAVVAIPASGPATPYPSTITVSGVTGAVNRVSVRLNGFSHAFPDDVDVLLVSPAGQKVLLMSDAGGGHTVTNLSLTFSDGNATVPDSTALASGTFSPTDYETDVLDSFPAPAPAGTPGVALAAFKGGSPNGDWSLYVVDDSTGDAGAIGGGWVLTLDTVNVVNPLADLIISISAAPAAGTPNPPFVGSALIYTIGVVNNGPDAATGVSVTDTLPAGLSYVSSTSSQGSIATGGTITWTVGSLSAGSSAMATIRTATTTGGSIQTTAAVTGTQSDLNTINNTAQVTTNVRVPAKAVLSEVVVTNAQLQFTLTGDAGLSYKILASTNLTTWTALSTNTAAANGTIKFIDTAGPAYLHRFYRAERLIP